jgi:hypothetical protein
MYDQIREDTLCAMLYAAVVMLSLIACCYLLFRRGNAFAPEITPPARLRRWTAMFFAILVVDHVWYMPIFFLTSSEDIMMIDLIGGLLDSMTVFPLMIVVLLAMLQDRRRPLWPVTVMFAPIVVGNAFNFTTPENSTSEVISVSLPEDATGFLLLDINGTQTHVPLVNGKANVTVPNLAEGAYNATITYTGDDKYAPISTTKELNVTSNVPDNALNIPASSKSDIPTTYSISLPEDATGYLEVEVDGTKYAAPLNKGSASVSIPALSAGNHNVTVTYTGDNKYSPVVKSTSLSVTAPVFKITNNKNVAAVYSAKATYKVLVTRDGKAVGAGQAVTIKYNGKTYTVKTDAKGYATFKPTTKVKVKKYTVTATYKGVTVKNTVTIKHVIKAKNAKIKKSKKVNKIKVKTKKVNGKYLKGKKLTLKIKGKKVKAKTNKKGVATFTIKNSVYKKLKTNKKYTYQVIYGKDKVKKTIKFKK